MNTGASWLGTQARNALKGHMGAERSQWQEGTQAQDTERA